MKTIDIIKNPRITEKASNMLGQNVYTFNIGKSANKKEVSKAIFALYKVKPAKINISNIIQKKTFFKGVAGAKSGGRKAYVYLKEGDKIEFI